jgi:hypothetical protein
MLKLPKRGAASHSPINAGARKVEDRIVYHKNKNEVKTLFLVNSSKNQES